MIPEAFLRNQLKRVEIKRKVFFDENKAKLCCPWHNKGRERTPSLVINLNDKNNHEPGEFFCFACSKRGKWNRLAKKLGLQIAKNQGNFVYPELLASNLDQMQVNDDEQPAFVDDNILFAPSWPVNRKWRGIDGKLINQLGGKKIPTQYKWRLHLPVVIDKTQVGYINCSPNKYSKLKYIYAKGKWIRTSLFPYDHVKKMLKKQNKRILFLAEGPRDALRMIQFGLPTLANLGGITVWTELKAELILALEPDLVVLAFDPDSIGQQLTNMVKQALQDSVEIKILKFKNSGQKKRDPGNIPESRAVKIKQGLGII